MLTFYGNVQFFIDNVENRLQFVAWELKI